MPHCDVQRTLTGMSLCPAVVGSSAFTAQLTAAVLAPLVWCIYEIALTSELHPSRVMQG